MPHFVCENCEYVATQEEWLTPKPPACPKCGNKFFIMTADCSLEFSEVGAAKIIQRDPHERSDKKRRREEFIGPDPNKDGKLMHKRRLIDKDTDYYYEEVVDPDTGEVVRFCEEKLSNHMGRGSAKKKRDQSTSS